MLLSCSKNVIWRLDSFWWLTLCVLPFHCSEVLQGVRNQLWRGTRHIPEAKMGFALLNGSCNGQTPSALSTLAFREQRGSGILGWIHQAGVCSLSTGSYGMAQPLFCRWGDYAMCHKVSFIHHLLPQEAAAEWDVPSKHVKALTRSSVSRKGGPEHDAQDLSYSVVMKGTPVLSEPSLAWKPLQPSGVHWALSNPHQNPLKTRLEVLSLTDQLLTVEKKKGNL